MCYLGGQGKDGQQQLQEVGRYPSLMNLPSSTHQYCGQEYPSLLLPCNRIHIKLGGCNHRPGKLLHILALPKEFPLALSFAHYLSEVFACSQLETTSAECAHAEAGSDTSSMDKLCALFVCLEGLTKFISRMNCPISIKELILHELANILWTLCSTSWPRPECEGPEITPFTFHCNFLQGILEELLKLYNSEATQFTKSKTGEGKHLFPPPDSIGAGGLGKFSTYLQALLEFVLAAFHYQHLFHGADLYPLLMADPSSLSSSSSSAASTTAKSQVSVTAIKSASVNDKSTTTEALSGAVPSSEDTSTMEASPTMEATPTVAATPSLQLSPVRKPSKRGRHRKSAKKEGRNSVQKKEEWLNMVRSASSLLRSVALWRDSALLSIANRRRKSSMYEYHLTLHQPHLLRHDHPCSRLLVLSSISPNLDQGSIEDAIRKCCRLYGGLYMNEMFFTPNVASSKASDSGGIGCDSSTSMGAVIGGGSDPLISRHASPQAAILELRCGSHTSAVCSALLACCSLHETGEVRVAEENEGLQALAVNNAFSCGEQEVEANQGLLQFLRFRLTSTTNTGCESVSAASTATFNDIFASSVQGSSCSIGMSEVTGSLGQFLSGYAKGCGQTVDDLRETIWISYGSKKGQLYCEGFVKFVVNAILEDWKEEDGKSLRSVWHGLLECGYDFHLHRSVMCVHVLTEHSLYLFQFCFWLLFKKC